MVPLKDTSRKNNYSPVVPASKPVSKTFVIIVVAVAALLVLGVLLLFTNQFVGKALYSQTTTKTALTDTSSSRTVVQQAPTVTDTSKQIAPVSSDLVKEATIQPSQDVSAESASVSLSLGQDTLTTITDSLRLDLEVKDASTSTFWVDMYLTSSNHATLTKTSLELSLSDQNAAKFASGAIMSFSPPFKDVLYQKLGDCSNLNYCIIYQDSTKPTIQLIKGAKIYLGKIKMQRVAGAASSANFQIAVSTNSVASFSDPSAGSYKVQQTSLSVCVPSTTLPACGVKNNGCGKTLKAQNDCAEGSACVNNECKTAISQLSSSQDQLLCQGAIDAPAEDKTLLGGVLSALQTNSDKGDAILAIFTVLNTWFQ